MKGFSGRSGFRGVGFVQVPCCEAPGPGVWISRRVGKQARGKVKTPQHWYLKPF